MIEIRVTGDKEVALALDKAAARSIPAVYGVVEKGALNIKEDAKQRVSGLAHASKYPSSITYDMAYGLGSIEAEIGPDKSRRQGALGNLLEFGSVNNAPIPHMVPALRSEETKFSAAMEAMATGLLGD